MRTQRFLNNISREFFLPQFEMKIEIIREQEMREGLVGK